MASFTPISKALHATKAWVRPTNYAFAARDSAVPVVGLEVVPAALNMPLAFFKTDTFTQLVAITSPRPGDNFFVAKDGRWIGAYIPGILRSYPFRVGRVEGQEEMALCLADDAIAEDGEPIYDGAGELAPMVKNSLSMLEAYEKSRQRTLFAAAALEEAGVLAPWPITIKSTKSGKEVAVNGALRVDERALNALDDEAFIKLRKVGALPIAYAQMISMSRLGVLSRLAELREKMSAQRPAKKENEFNLDFLREEDGNLIF